MRTALLLLLLTGCIGAASTYEAANHEIRVVQKPDGQYVAIAPQCPEWSPELVDKYTNAPTPQLGCATARNLANMIADPRDLQKGRADTTGPSDVTANAITRYKAGEPRPLQNAGTP